MVNVSTVIDTKGATSRIKRHTAHIRSILTNINVANPFKEKFKFFEKSSFGYQPLSGRQVIAKNNEFLKYHISYLNVLIKGLQDRIWTPEVLNHHKKSTPQRGVTHSPLISVKCNTSVFKSVEAWSRIRNVPLPSSLPNCGENGEKGRLHFIH
jgi:hypothetical protein